MDPAILKLYLVQISDLFNVDEVLVVDQPFLHGQEQFGSAGIDLGRFPVLRQKIGGVFYALRFL